jgi:serine/threonine-protein kinase
LAVSRTPPKLGKYEVRAPLGSGATATVYQAWDPVIERTLAIKVVDRNRLDPEEAPLVVERFRVEARAAGRLQHPNVVAVYDFGEQGELVYLVMECVFGRPLTAYLEAEDFRSEPEKACEIVLQILGALQYAHTHGVVHRDIKPANVMVSRDGAIKVADFGVARIESSNLTQTGDVIGTPSYMSPEQFAGETADPRTDLYAVGVILYELLTRRRPFEGPNNAVIMHKVFTETPKAPSVLNTLLTPVLDAIVARGMAKDPLDRFQSATEFEQAVRDALTRPLLKSAGAAAGPRIAPNLLKAVQKNPSDPNRAGAGDSERTVPLARAPGGSATVTLPVRGTAGLSVPPNRAAALATLSGARSIPGRRRPVIMFVDDEARILNALQSIFSMQYEVHVCDDPVKAVEMLKRLPVQVLVSDQRMPQMLGVDLLRASKEISPRTVRILLTGYSDLASIVGSINDGEVWRFINKPWDSQDIQRTVAEAVQIFEQVPEIPSWQAPAAPSRDEAILVLDPRNDLVQPLTRVFGERHWVVRVDSIDAALGQLDEREVAVMVVDMDQHTEGVRALLSALKSTWPQILTVAVTTAADADQLIDLINEAQVYRFVSRPVDFARLASHIDGALNRYHAYKATPALAEARARVAEPKGAVGQALGGLLERVRSLRLPFGRSRNA